MKLLLEVLGVLVIAGAITASYGAGHTRTTVASAALVAAVATGVAFWSGAWSEAKTLISAHKSNGLLTREEANTRGGTLFPANEGLLAFADEAIPRTARVYLFCGPSQVGCSSEWISYRLSPRVFVPSPQQAQWAVIYGGTPAQAPFARGWQILSFDANNSVAKAPQ